MCRSRPPSVTSGASRSCAAPSTTGSVSSRRRPNRRSRRRATIGRHLPTRQDICLAQKREGYCASVVSRPAISRQESERGNPRLDVYCSMEHIPQKTGAAGMCAEERFDTDVTAGAAESGPAMLIGRYRLLQTIGEGGMGQVWLAEQKEPVRRRVALKVVKAGMNSREVIARFESERQALALMDHPAIAKVFDAGSTREGAPYFVMEYVAGFPITTYCDNHRMSLRKRLELFVQVCEGVQHAHQKAIIHHDLKPSNVLVTEVNGRAAPKIIDFGVAKALGQRLTRQTLHTRAGTLVGTLEYMSPQQALSPSEDIDTRTDVYSLGTLFYELLTGAPPLELR